MRKLSALVIVVAAAAGCGAVDPCAGRSGVCIGLRVEGSVSGLEVLDVAVVSGALMEAKKTPSAQLSLPVAVALDLPAGTSGDVDITVYGESDDGKVLASGMTSLTLTGTHGKATVKLAAVSAGTTIDLSGFSGASDLSVVSDLSGGQGSTDMAGCGLVTQCTSGDGCCPAGCDGSNDHDCASVCGNHVTEPGESCDDGNVVGGDGCDPTCAWSENLVALAGKPGAIGSADSASALIGRMADPSGVAWDATNTRAYVSDSLTCVIRVSANNGLTTLVGSPWNCDGATPTDGDFKTARFASPSDLELIGTTLYVVDQLGAALRAIDLTGQTVKTIALPTKTSTTSGLGQYGGKLMFFNYDSATPTNDGLWSFDGAAFAQISMGLLPANVAQAPTQCQDVACSSTTAKYCYIGCGGNVVAFDMVKLSGFNLVGYVLPGTTTFQIGCQPAGTQSGPATKLTTATHLGIDLTNNTLEIVDSFCNDIIRVPTLAANPVSAALLAGGASQFGGYADGSSALFSQPGGIAYDNSGYIVADSANGVLRHVSSVGSTTTYTLAGAVHDISAVTFTTTPTTSTHFTSSYSGMASDGSYIYALAAGGEIDKISLSDSSVSLFLAPTSQVSGASWYDLVLIGDTLYENASNNRIYSIPVAGGSPAVYANTGGDATPTDVSRLAAGMSPSRLASDGTNLFFTDSRKLVREIDAAGMVHTIAGSIGSSDAADGTGSAGHFAYADAITIVGGTAYVADTTGGNPGQGIVGPSAIRAIDIASGKVTTIAGDIATNGHVDGAALTARFSAIRGLASDGHSLFISDDLIQYNDPSHSASTIRQLVLGTMQVDTMVGIPGQGSFAAGKGTSALIHSPKHIIFDSQTHALFFFDGSEYTFGRIR